MGNYCYTEPSVPQGYNMLSVPVGLSPGHANKLVQLYDIITNNRASNDKNHQRMKFLRDSQ